MKNVRAYYSSSVLSFGALSLIPPPALCQTALPCGQVVAGTITAAGQIDAYTFDAAAGDAITIRASRTAGSILNFNVFLELYAPDGSPLASAGWQIDQKLTVSGAYALKVRDDNKADTGAYLLTWQKTTSPCNATPLSPGQAAVGTIGITVASPSWGFYSFTGAAGDMVTIRAARTSGSTLNFNLTLELYAPDGTLIGNAGWQLDKTLGINGTYLVIVRDDNISDTGGYEVTWEKVNTVPTDAAIHLDPGQVAVGTIGTAPSSPAWGYYSFTGAAGDVVTVRAARTSGSTLNFNLSLELYGPDGTRIGTAAWQVDSTLPADGTYLIIVRDDNTSDTGNYAVTWQKVNGNPGNAPPLGCGQTAVGTIGASTASPPWWYYSFTGATGDVVTLRAARTLGSTLNFNLALELYGPDGTRIGNAGWQVDSTLPANGTYLVIVRDDNISDTGNFAFSWQKVNSNPGNAAALDSGQVAVGDISTTTAAPPWWYYSFTGTVGDMVTLRAARTSGSTLNFNLALELYGPDGTRIGNAGWQVDSTLPANGTYLVIVRDDNISDTGGFAVTRQRLNGNPGNAAALSCGNTVAGSLGLSPEPPPWRYYSFVGLADNYMALQAVRTSGSTLNFNVNLELYAPDGSQMGNALWNLQQTLTSDGIYTLIVRDDTTSDTGTYNLTASGCYLSPNNPDILYTYDQLGRLTGVLYPSGKQITFTYDERGNRTQETVVGGK